MILIYNIYEKCYDIQYNILSFIKSAKSEGFTLEQIRNLFSVHFMNIPDIVKSFINKLTFKMA